MRMLRFVAIALSLALAASGAHAGKFLRGARSAGGGGCSTAAVAAPSLTGSPSLIGSWDFGDTAKITLASGKISQITGSDSTAFTLTQGTTAAQPVPITLGCYQAAQFDGAQSLKIASALGRANSDVFTIVVIGENRTSAQNGTFVSFANSTGSSSNFNRHKVRANGTYLGWQLQLADNSTHQETSVSTLATPFDLGRHLIVGAAATSTNTMTLYKDGTQLTTATSQFTAVNTNYAQFMVGGDQVADFLNGYVWRVLLYAGTLTSTNASELQTWALANWGATSTGSSSSTAVVNFEKPSSTASIDGYKVYYSKTYGGTDNSVTLSGSSSNSTTITGLTTGTWYFMVRATFSGNEGDNINLDTRQIK